ncbi:adenine specific DNA methyltransferase [Candidatus Vecturithrix granuli]|uniref:site-specific DNA-methyltransferase (adenine-specific) n=1 Tax=Vecturithrix granuli TaxID=1499967 RepID=A0A081C3D4_VECG1|nr:adenine specific DNA methyltransferase [Candidatus Vecturithrix granuli]
MIQRYLDAISTRYQTGIAREHSYRGDLQQLIESLAPDVLATNEPARIACGAPDYILTRGSIPVGYIEAKDIGASLDKVERSEQMQRYAASLENLILTDYLEFRLYRQGKFVTAVALADLKNGDLRPLSQNWQSFEHLMLEFCAYSGQTITSAQKLAEMMAAKARMMQTVIEQALLSDEENEQNSSLKDQMIAFKRILIHDITPAAFADIYAQTIAYGMFAARLHDPTPDSFSRQEAAELIPKTNPFLRKLFSYIAGVDIDDRILWIVDALAAIFRATDMAAFMQHFGQTTQMHDPVIHFYETFLAEYNPKLRKSRGVWYTPEPVVNFIVRAVDELLKTEFGLLQGLADTSKITIEVDTQIEDQRSKTGYKREKQEVHKLQILDPAAGTGTFLAEVIKQIYAKFAGQQGMWSNYVEEHLIPRLHGFEILMASYAMAHLKLELLLRETGYQPKQAQRFRIFLTNSLEEAHPDTGTLFASWLSREATEANYIKRDTPVMVVLGNPPYSGHSANKSDWIDQLLQDYKQEPGGGKLQEKNPKWLNDDYVKFIRYGQYFIEKNGEGILAFINNHSFLDNPTFRGMRWHLLTTFDRIYVLDLHGNAKKKEVCPDGSPDKNVFDIQQGVSINLFVKTGQKKSRRLAEVYHYDLFGEREAKYEFLWKSNLQNIGFTKLVLSASQYFFVQKNFDVQKKYDEGFAVNILFPVNSVGIVTSRDAFVTDDDKEALRSRIKHFFRSDAAQIRTEYGLKENKSWKIEAIQHKSQSFDEQYIRKMTYRPFEDRYVYYEPNFIERSRYDIMQHFLKKENVGIVIPRQAITNNWSHVQVSKNIIDNRIHYSNKGIPILAPLYLYPTTDIQQTLDGGQKRRPNLNPKIIKQIADTLGLTFTSEKEDAAGTFVPLDLLDYIYAVLHSPTYRETYKEFLKIDFPRIPYPKNQKSFWQLVALGGELRQLHLLESPKVLEFITAYPQDGDNRITRKITSKDYEMTDREQQIGRVWVNDRQYFDKVPKIAWEFYIGGYQPAQKWLKDRQGRTLNFDEILHYQKMIVALAETARIMQAIDQVDFLE